MKDESKIVIPIFLILGFWCLYIDQTGMGIFFLVLGFLFLGISLGLGNKESYAPDNVDRPEQSRVDFNRQKGDQFKEVPRSFKKDNINEQAINTTESGRVLPEKTKYEEVDIMKYVKYVTSETGLSEKEALIFALQKEKEYFAEELSKQNGPYNASLSAKYRLNKEKPLP
jgi:hypothetical protein